MNLSRAQLGQFWRAFGPAWAAHARQSGIAPGNAVARDEFRRRLILTTTGCASLTTVPRAGRPYADLMAALEQTARDGIRWTLKVDSGAADAAVPQFSLGKLMCEHRLTERYVRGIAARALRRPEPPHLHELSAAETATLVSIIRAQFARREVAA